MLRALASPALALLTAALSATAAAPAASAGVCAGAAPELLSGEHGDDATEYWDLTARLEPGYLLFQRFLVTNVGPGERTAAAVGIVVRPDGRIDHFDNGRREGRWTLEGGSRLHVGKSALDLRASGPRLEIGKKSARLDLTLACDADAAAQPPASFARAGHALRVLAVSAPIRGTLWLRGMPEPLAVEGRAAFTHTLAPDEADAVERRLEFHSLGADLGWSVFSVTPRHEAANSNRGQAPRGENPLATWLVVTRGGRTVYATDRAQLDLAGSAPDWDRAGYPVPARMQVRSARLQARVELGAVLHARDPLSTLPGPFRFWVGLRMDPLRAWARGRFAGTLRPGAPGGGEPGTGARGAGVQHEPEPDAVAVTKGTATSQTLPKQTLPRESVENVQRLEGVGVAVLTYIHPAAPPARAQRPDEASHSPIAAAEQRPHP